MCILVLRLLSAMSTNQTKSDYLDELDYLCGTDSRPLLSAFFLQPNFSNHMAAAIDHFLQPTSPSVGQHPAQHQLG